MSSLGRISYAEEDIARPCLCFNGAGLNLEYIESKFDQLLRLGLDDDENSSIRISGTGV